MTGMLELLVVFVLARLVGGTCERFGQPATVGELFAGLLLGYLVLTQGEAVPFLQGLADSVVIEQAALLGMFVLVLQAGIEMRPAELRQHSVRALAVAAGGVVVPLAAGFALTWAALPAMPERATLAFLVGVALSISAIPAITRVLADLGLLHSEVGRTIISAAIFDDVLGLILLAGLITILTTGAAPEAWPLLLLIFKVAVFFAVTVTLGVHVYPRVRRGLRTLQATAMEFSALVAVALTYSVLAEYLDLHWILGAFMAGLFFEPSRVGIRAYAEMRVLFNAVTAGLLGPLFFASVGLRVDVTAVGEVPLFLTVLLIVAILGKIVGAGLPAYWFGLGRRESVAVGVGLSARGAVELVILGVAYESGIFLRADNGEVLVTNLFSALVLVAIVSTVLAPVLLRLILPKPPAE